jgi:hypothetical protein
MTNPTAPDPTDRGQHAPGISKTLEENATRFEETTTDERMEPKLRPVVPPSEKSEQREDERIG